MESITTKSQDGEEDWRNISDPKRRKRVQNRLSQRKRRQKCRQKEDRRESSSRASSFEEAVEDFGMSDMPDHLAFSPTSQNDDNDPFQNTELAGQNEDFLFQDLFSVNDFQRGSFSTTLESMDQPYGPIMSPNSVHPTSSCCAKPHLDSDDVLVTSRHPSPSREVSCNYTTISHTDPPRLQEIRPIPGTHNISHTKPRVQASRHPSPPRFEVQDIHPIPYNYTISHTEPQSYPLASRSSQECCSRCAQSIDNRPVSMSELSQRTTQHTPRAQPMDRMRSGQSGTHSTSYNDNCPKTRFDDSCDHVECQQYAPQREARTRRNSSYQSPKRTASISHDILAEHGIDLADILRVSSTSRRPDRTLPPKTSVTKQYPHATKTQSRAVEPHSGSKEVETRCDKIVILYLQNNREDEN